MLNESLARFWVSIGNILNPEGYVNLGYLHVSWLTYPCRERQYWQFRRSGLVLLWWILWCFLLGGWLLSTHSGHHIFIATAWVNSWGSYMAIMMYTFFSSKQHMHWQNSVLENSMLPEDSFEALVDDTRELHFSRLSSDSTQQSFLEAFKYFYNDPRIM